MASSIMGESLVAGLQRLFPRSQRADELAAALVAEHDNERLEERKKQHAQRERLRAQLLDESARSGPVLFRAAAATATAARALEEAREAEARVISEHRSASYDLSFQIDRLTGLIRRSASPIVDDFVTELRELIRQTFGERDCVSVPLIDGTEKETWNNLASINMRVEAIKRALEAADVLREELLTDSELLARCDALRSGLPPVEQRATAQQRA